jgi:hypothetical protein
MRVVTLRYAHGIFYRCSDDKRGLNPETAAVICSHGQLRQEVGSTGQVMDDVEKRMGRFGCEDPACSLVCR